jgi:hypothetical protein
MAISRIRWRLYIAQKIEDSKKAIAAEEEENDKSDETCTGPSSLCNESGPDDIPGARHFFYPQKSLEGIEKGSIASDVITSNGRHFPGHHNKPHFSNFHSDLLRFISVLKSAYIASTGQIPVIPDSWPPASVPVSYFATQTHISMANNPTKDHSISDD